MTVHHALAPYSANQRINCIHNVTDADAVKKEAQSLQSMSIKDIKVHTVMLDPIQFMVQSTSDHVR